jgi:hypothetical protein
MLAIVFVPDRCKSTEFLSSSRPHNPCRLHPHWQHTTNPVAFATPPRTVGTGKTTTSASPSDAKSSALGITSPGSSAATPPAGVKNIAQRFEAMLSASAGTGKHAGPASPMTPLKLATGQASVANMATSRQVTTASGATAASIMSSGANPNAAKTTSSVGSARVQTTSTSNGALRTEVSGSGNSSASAGSSASRTARPASAPSASGGGVKNLAQLFAASAAGAHGGAAAASAAVSDPGSVVMLAEELSRRKLEQIGLGSLKNLNFSKTGTQAGEGDSKGKLLDKVHTEASKVCKEYGVSVTKDGRIDERCAAWRRGNIFYDAKGNIADNVGGKLASEMYYQNTVGAHMEGWQEYAASLKGTGITLTMDELKQVISSINADDTVRAGVHEGTERARAEY